MVWERQEMMKRLEFCGYATLTSRFNGKRGFLRLLSRLLSPAFLVAGLHLARNNAVLSLGPLRFEHSQWDYLCFQSGFALTPARRKIKHEAEPED